MANKRKYTELFICGLVLAYKFYISCVYRSLTICYIEKLYGQFYKKGVHFLIYNVSTELDHRIPVSAYLDTAQIIQNSCFSSPGHSQVIQNFCFCSPEYPVLACNQVSEHSPGNTSSKLQIHCLVPCRGGTSHNSNTQASTQHPVQQMFHNTHENQGPILRKVLRNNTKSSFLQFNEGCIFFFFSMRFQSKSVGMMKRGICNLKLVMNFNLNKICNLTPDRVVAHTCHNIHSKVLFIVNSYPDHQLIFFIYLNINFQNS